MNNGTATDQPSRPAEASRQPTTLSRFQVACYALIASAFVLGGLLLVHAQDQLQPAAEAELVMSQGGVTYLVAPTRNGMESLFILDGTRGVLNIYTLNVSREQLELAESLDVNRLFQ